MKRILALMIGAVMLTSILMACGNGEQADPPSDGNGAAGEIDFNAEFTLRFTGPIHGGERAELLQIAADRLRETWPNVTIANEATPDWDTDLRLAFSAGDGFEMVYVDDLNQQMLVEAGHLMDITEHVIERRWRERSVDGAVAFNNLRKPGVYYSVPFLMAPIHVYYNKDIFASIDAEIPTTVAEFADVMQMALDNGYIPMESGGDNMFQILWIATSIVQNQAPKDEIDDWYYMIYSSEAVREAFIEAFQIVLDWYQAGFFREGFQGIRLDDVAMMFAMGETAAIVGGDWDLPEIDASGLNVGVFSFPPVVATDEPVTIINAVDGAWALNADLDANQTAAALDWIEIFFDIEYAIMWYELGFSPTILGDYSGAEVSALKTESTLAAAATSMGFYLDNVRPGYLEVMNTGLQRLIMGELTPEELWDVMYEEWNRP